MGVKSRPAPPLPSCGEQGVPAGLRPRPRPWEEPSQPPGPRTPGKAQGRASRSPAWGSAWRQGCRAARLRPTRTRHRRRGCSWRGQPACWRLPPPPPASGWLPGDASNSRVPEGGCLPMGRAHSHPHLPLPWCSKAVGGPALWGSPPHEEVRDRGVVHPDSGSTHSVRQRKAGSRQGTALGVYGLSHQPLKRRKVQTWFVEQDLAAALSGPHRPQAQGRPLGQPGASAHQCGLRERRCGGAWRLSSLAPPPRALSHTHRSRPSQEGGRETRPAKAGLGGPETTLLQPGPRARGQRPGAHDVPEDVSPALGGEEPTGWLTTGHQDPSLPQPDPAFTRQGACRMSSSSGVSRVEG